MAPFLEQRQRCANRRRRCFALVEQAPATVESALMQLVVIGRETYRATPETAREAIGGISVVHDVSGRRAQLETPLRQFTLGKSFDTFTPMGPAIAAPDGFDLVDIDCARRCAARSCRKPTPATSSSASRN